MNPSPDQLPPHSPPDEAGLVACVLQAPGTMDFLRERQVTADWFYDLRYQSIFAAYLRMDEARQPIEFLTVMSALRSAGLLEEIGGNTFLSALQDATPSAANWSRFYDVVREKWQLRKLIATCTNAVTAAFACDRSPDKLLETVESDIAKLTESATEAAEKSAKQVIHGVIADMEDNHYTRGKQQLRGLPTGQPGNFLDKVLRGIRETHYVVLAGRPGDGKTSLAANMLEYLALDYVWHQPTGEKNPDGIPLTVERKGIPIAVFSIEMDAQSLGYRLVFGHANVDSALYNQGYAAKDDEVKLIKAAGKLANAQFWIDDSPGQTIGQIAAKARRMARQYGIKLFVLDYLQLVETEDGNGYDRVRELTKISRKIMSLKKQLGVPWLVLAQMNRNIEQSEAKRVPVLSDLKDCGAIEQDADAVMFLYKPDRKELDKSKPGYQDGKSDNEILNEVFEGEDWSKRPRRVNLFVAKNRYGPTGNVQFLFQNNLCRFEDWHLWKVSRNLEAMKKGETERGLGLVKEPELPQNPSPYEMDEPL